MIQRQNNITLFKKLCDLEIIPFNPLVINNMICLLLLANDQLEWATLTNTIFRKVSNNYPHLINILYNLILIKTFKEKEDIHLVVLVR